MSNLLTQGDPPQGNSGMPQAFKYVVNSQKTKINMNISCSFLFLQIVTAS